MAAGRAWAGARPSADRTETEADAAAFGLTLPAPEEDRAVEVWETHRTALRAFLSIAGQWRTGQVGAQGVTKVVWLGLDYTAAQAGLALAGLAVPPEVWAEVQVIEAGAREGLNRG